MTILDTFTLDYGNNGLQQAKNDLSAYDKQISELAAKGKKRTEEENKQLKELRKQRQEATQDIKDQTREVDKLGDSFQNMVQGAVGAVTAYASFGALKAGLINANNLNASLQILQRQYGVSAVAAKAYGIAVERSTGVKADALYSFAAQASADAEGKRLPFNLESVLNTLHDRFKNLSPQAAQPLIQQIPGAAPLLPFLQLNDEEFEKAKREGFGLAGTEKDFKAAIENQEAVSKTNQAFGALATQIDTNLHDAIKTVTEDLQGLAKVLEGHPNVALGGGIVTALGATAATGWASVKALQGLRWLGGLFGLGGAGAATATVGTAGEGLSLAGAGLYALPAAVGALLTWGSSWVGDKIGNAIKAHRRGSNEENPAPSPDDQQKQQDSGPKVRLADNSGAKTAKQRIYDFWIAQGYSAGAAAGWTANAQAESSFNPAAGFGTSHQGIYQWDATRRARIKAVLGIDVGNASLDDQLKAAAWEAKMTHNLGPDAFNDSAGQSAALISNKFEIPSTTPAGLAAEASKRARIAESYGTIPTSGLGIGTPEAGSGRSVSVKIDDVTINTQATDSQGIAREVSAELKNQIRMAMSNIDDGVLA